MWVEFVKADVEQKDVSRVVEGWLKEAGLLESALPCSQSRRPDSRSAGSGSGRAPACPSVFGCK